MTAKSACRTPYLVILDFEATCDGTKGFAPQEIIEFPMVVVDSRTAKVIGEFQRFARPVVHPELRPFCTKLTGITQQQVNTAETYEVVHDAALGFLNAPPLKLNEPNFTFVTCGGWDLDKMLPSQYNTLRSRGINIGLNPCFSKFFNVKKDFAGFYREKAVGMKSMLDHLNIPLTGRHHSGIDDSRNIAKITIRMLEDGYAFTDNTLKTVGKTTVDSRNFTTRLY